VDHLAEQIEPIAQAMAQISQETKDTIEKSAEVHSQKITQLFENTKESVEQINKAEQDLLSAIEAVEWSAGKISQGVEQMNSARKMLSVKVIALAVGLGLLIGTGAGIGSWTLLKRHWITTEAIRVWGPDEGQRVANTLLQK
jgi:uncharacterized membrane protein YccC